jgi:hypothetical protein
VPVRGTIVPFGDFAGTVPAVPAVGMTCGLVSQKVEWKPMLVPIFFPRVSRADAWDDDDAVIKIQILGID